MTSSGRLKRLLTNLSLSIVATIIALSVLDVLLIATGLFPPTYDYGDSKAGWLSARPTGQMEKEGCLDPYAKQVIYFDRNEAGVRTTQTVAELTQPGTGLRIGVTGDSHTDLCARNADTHFGVLERELIDRGRAATVFAFGAGKYSPLQAYLAVDALLSDYHADALVLNLYTGNDFYDMLRVDDRPHFVVADTGYAIAPPVWYQQDPPGVTRRSRVVYALRVLAQRTGVRRVYLRVKYLRDVASAQGEGLTAVFGYMNDLRRAVAPEVGYPQAYTAQMLNQQLFFHHFPASRVESERRVAALLRYIRAQRPNLLLVLSPIPSVRLVQQARTDSSFRDVLSRLPVDFEEGVQEEESLYDALRSAAGESGWVFVDILPKLRAHQGSELLYNEYDLHIGPTASAIIGQAQALAIDDALADRIAAERRQ